MSPRRSSSYKPGMVTITGMYSGGLRCVARHGPSEAELITDAPVDNHGQGRSFSPTDLVATALATCVITTMAIWAERHQLPFAGATYTVTKEMATTSPRRIARLGLTVRVPGKYTEHERERLSYVAHACPVHQSLHESVKIDLKLEWADGGKLGSEGLEPTTSPV